MHHIQGTDSTDRGAYLAPNQLDILNNGTYQVVNIEYQKHKWFQRSPQITKKDLSALSVSPFDNIGYFPNKCITYSGRLFFNRQYNTF